MGLYDIFKRKNREPENTQSSEQPSEPLTAVSGGHDALPAADVAATQENGQCATAGTGPSDPVEAEPEKKTTIRR